jgi:phosphatidylglycerophosphate synthase
MVTLLGVFCQMIGIIVILFYDNTMSLPLPKWIYILFALLIFGAQTFDAIDGKHARNTKRSSPLGQLMDHGCDAFSNSFMIIMICQTHLFSSTKYTIIIQACVQVYIYKIGRLLCISMGRKSNWSNVYSYR